MKKIVSTKVFSIALLTMLISVSSFATPGEEDYLPKAVKMLIDLKKVVRSVNLDFKMNYAMEKEQVGSSSRSAYYTTKFLDLYTEAQKNMAFIQVYVDYLSSRNELIYNLKIQGYVASMSTAVIALNEIEAAAQTVGFDLKRSSVVYDDLCADYYFSEKMKKPAYYKSTFQAGVEKFRGWKFHTYNCN